MVKKEKTITKWQYSRQVLTAFIILSVTYLLLVGVLLLVHHLDAISFDTDTQGGDYLLRVAVSLPFMALYLLIFIAATAGFARGAIMARGLPFNQVIKQELQKKTMQGENIITKIRSGSTVTPETSYLRALHTSISGRLRIMAVVDPDNRVMGVITSRDILSKLQEETDKQSDHGQLFENLANITVADLKPRRPVVALTSDNLETVMSRMITHQFTKLVVVDNEETLFFRGTVDMLDMAAEIFEDASEE